MNYKFSLLFSDFLKYFDDALFNYTKNETKELDKNNSSVKSKFEKKMKIINIFEKTIKNEKKLLGDELYYRYLKIVSIIMNLSIKKRITSNIIEKIKKINYCMIHLIEHSHLINFIKENPKTLFLRKNDNEIELNEVLIKDLSLNEILIYKTNKEVFIF